MMADQQKVRGRPGIIPQALCRNQEISAVAKVVFGLLTTYEVAYPGQEWLAIHVPCSKPTLNLALKELELHGWIKREARNRREGETTLYHVYVDGPIPLESRPDWVKEAWREGLSSRDLLKQIKLNRLSKSRELEKYEVTRQDEVQDEIKSKINTMSGSPSASRTPPVPTSPKRNGDKSTTDQLAEEILAYLNERASKRFQPSKTSLSKIRARLREGFAPDELRLVIDYKVAQWGKDERMREYLRPRTLFGPENFENYLVAAKEWDARGRPPLNGRPRKKLDNVYVAPKGQRVVDQLRALGRI